MTKPKNTKLSIVLPQDILSIVDEIKSFPQWEENRSKVITYYLREVFKERIEIKGNK